MSSLSKTSYCLTYVFVLLFCGFVGYCFYCVAYNSVLPRYLRVTALSGLMFVSDVVVNAAAAAAAVVVNGVRCCCYYC